MRNKHTDVNKLVQLAHSKITKHSQYKIFKKLPLKKYTICSIFRLEKQSILIEIISTFISKSSTFS